MEDGEQEEEEDDEVDDDDDVMSFRPWMDQKAQQRQPNKSSPSFKNPRNVPSDSCPRDEDLAQTQVFFSFIINKREKEAGIW